MNTCIRIIQNAIFNRKTSMQGAHIAVISRPFISFFISYLHTAKRACPKGSYYVDGRKLNHRVCICNNMKNRHSIVRVGNSRNQRVSKAKRRITYYYHCYLHKPILLLTVNYFNFLTMTANETKDADANIVYEKINFTPDNDIARSFPILLADNGKMSVMIWNEFCDKIDACTAPIGKVRMIHSILWFAIIALIILSACGWTFTNNFARYYGVIIPVVVILMVAACYLEAYILKKAASKISKICASHSNYDRNLKMTLQTDKKKDGEIDGWYIEIALRNATDVEAANVAIPVAVGTAIPVAGAVPAGGGPAPKKYLKVNGKMTLNPDYISWKNANQ